MVQIELHLRDDILKFGNQTAQDARFRHLAQRRFRIVGQQDFKKQVARFDRAADAANQFRIVGNQLQRARIQRFL